MGSEFWVKFLRIYIQNIYKPLKVSKKELKSLEKPQKSKKTQNRFKFLPEINQSKTYQEKIGGKFRHKAKKHTQNWVRHEKSIV